MWDVEGGRQEKKEVSRCISLQREKDIAQSHKTAAFWLLASAGCAKGSTVSTDGMEC